MNPKYFIFKGCIYESIQELSAYFIYVIRVYTQKYYNTQITKVMKLFRIGGNVRVVPPFYQRLRLLLSS